MRRRRQVLLLSLLTALTVAAIFFFNHKKLPTPWISRQDQNDHAKARDPCKCPATGAAAKCHPSGTQNFHQITCQINREVATNIGVEANKSIVPFIDDVGCRVDRESRQVYVPFSFIKSYFEVQGDFDKESDEFKWSHSYSRVFPSLKDNRYNPLGTFLRFAQLDVENRPRVKVLSGADGVPISTQWDKKGYYYPTQICQYGLSHWSKATVNAENDVKDINLDGDWVAKGHLVKVFDENCLHFEGHVRLDVNKTVNSLNFIVGFDLKLEDNVTVSLTVKLSGSSTKFTVKYVPKNNIYISKQGTNIIIGYGVVNQADVPEKKGVLVEGRWKRFTRNVANDILKGLGRKNFGKLMSGSKNMVLERVAFEGIGCFVNVSIVQPPRSNMRLFLQAADWLVENQDVRGGWPVGVVFNEGNFKYPKAKEIPAGWNSAMAQGHALSVLTRAYSATKEAKYLDAASKALAPFKNPTTESGVYSKFMDKHVWYEEYPTRPSTFVLNGFMYSLLGLYDYWKYLQQAKDLNGNSKDAEKLFKEGYRSLTILLSFYDSGSGSFYDLRHFTMPGEPPKIARWDYHSLHINLLFVLSSIKETDLADGSDILLQTAYRWQRYMYGQRTGHN